MPRKKKARDDAKRAKTSSQMGRQNSRRNPQPDLLDTLSPLADLPLDVRRTLLSSLVGEEMADVMLSSTSADEADDESRDETPSERLLRRADEAPTPAERRRRLQELVERDPDCVEAWTQLAESQDHVEEAIPLYEQAVAAAERALPEHLRTGELDRHDKGVRTYIWTLRDLMECLKSAHRLDDAIALGRQILRREPQDHTATRYELLGLLLETGRHSEAESLLEAYPDEFLAVWPVGRLLLAIQTRAEENERLALLRAMHKNNRYVIDYLLGRRPLPVDMPPMFTPGEPSDAVNCVQHLRKAWASTPGAIAWLREAAGKAGLLKQVPAEAQFVAGLGELLDSFDNTSIRDLPDHPEPVWIAGNYEMPAVHRPGRKRKKKIWVMYAIAEDGPINVDILESRPNANDLWQWLLETMRFGDQPGRPERIEFPQSGICRQLRIEAIRAGVHVDVCQDPPHLEALFDKLAQQLDWEGRSESVSDDDILELPQDPTDVWQCALSPLDDRLIDQQGELRRAAAAIVVSERDELFVTQDISVEEPDDQTLLNVLRQAMMIPLSGEPHRPAEVVVRHADDRLLLEPALSRWNINVRVDPELETLERLSQELSVLANEHSRPRMFSDPEITHEDREAFYEAACRFYRARPWQRWVEDDVICIECEATGPAPIYALVMGQSGLQTGLSLFDDRRLAERIFREPEGSVLPEVSGYSLTFEEEHEVPVPDLADIEQFGWPIATPEAYPVAARIDRGMTASEITRLPLRMLTGVMDAVASLEPGFETPVVIESADVRVTCHYDGRAR